MPEHAGSSLASAQSLLSINAILTPLYCKGPWKDCCPMVYVTEFDGFVSKAKALYEQNPSNVRYSMKYRHCDGMLVLKVTDDKVCLKFRTDKASDLKRVEEFNLNMMGVMATQK